MFIKDVLISQDATGASQEESLDYLEEANWNLDLAIIAFYDDTRPPLSQSHQCNYKF